MTGARRTPTQVAFGTIAHVRRNLAADGVRACRRLECPAHYLRPFQFDVPPRAAPHLERPVPTFEPLDAYEPEGDE